MTTNFYDRFVLPLVLDVACAGRPIRRQREKIVGLARGQVLEIGIGTGLNMPFYDPSRVQSITGVDPAAQLHSLAMKRARKAGLSVTMVGLSAETLPLEDETFDTVVCTYTLCTIPDPVSALREMRRVLGPGGRLLFSEHGRAPDASVRRWQDRLQPLWGKFSGGCQLGRDIPALLETAGFQPSVQSMYIPGPRFASYHYWGEAVAD